MEKAIHLATLFILIAVAWLAQESPEICDLEASIFNSWAHSSENMPCE